MKEKSQKIKKFQNDYVRSYIQSYFNSKQDLSTDYKETYENLSGDLYNKLGSGFDALQKSEATYDVKALEGHITSHMDDVAVTSDGTVNGTVHSSRVTKLLETDKPVSSNIAFGEDKQPILLYDYSNDPKAKLFVNNTNTMYLNDEFDHRKNPINSVLKEMGIEKTNGHDEFDTIGLGKYRSNSDFE
mgnify:CR=1 FL=1